MDAKIALILQLHLMTVVSVNIVGDENDMLAQDMCSGILFCSAWRLYLSKWAFVFVIICRGEQMLSVAVSALFQTKLDIWANYATKTYVTSRRLSYQDICCHIRTSAIHGHLYNTVICHKWSSVIQHGHLSYPVICCNQIFFYTCRTSTTKVRS